jgi:hypothetical protein
MAGVTFMGPRGAGVWVPAFAVNGDQSGVGWSSKSQYLNGRAGVLNSYTSHKEYTLTWSPTTRDALRPITDMASGMMGIGRIYWIDPMAARYNVAPEHLSWPAQAALDAPILVGSTRPTTITTPANTLGYPALSAIYSANAASVSTHIPIPPDSVAWVGWHGSGVGGLSVTPAITATSSATPVFPTVLAVTDQTRVNTSFSGSQYCGIDITLVGGTSVFSGIIVQILPVGVTPKTGGFISGQGNSGCRFEGKPTQTPYTAVDGSVVEIGMSAKLTEVDS